MYLTSITTQLRLGHASKLFTPHLIRLFLCQRQARRMIANATVQFTRQFPLHPARKIQPHIFNRIATLTLRPIGEFQLQIFEHIAIGTLHPVRKFRRVFSATLPHPCCTPLEKFNRSFSIKLHQCRHTHSPEREVLRAHLPRTSLLIV